MSAKNTPYLIAYYPARPSAPWKLELRASFAGKRIKRYFSTRAEAEAAGPLLVAQIRTQGVPGLSEKKAAGISLSAVLKTYREHKISVMHGLHLKTATQVFKALEEKFGNIPVDSIMPLELEKWIHSRGDSPTTSARYYRYIRMFWRWAYKKQLIEHNLIERIDAPSPRTRLHILRPEQMNALLALDCPKWLHSAFLLCGFTGLRTEELLRMDWSAVLHDEQSVHVARGIQKNSGGWTERYVDFTDPIKRRVKDLKGEGKIVPVPFITFRRKRVGAAKAIGLPGWPVNCLRHSFCQLSSRYTWRCGKNWSPDGTHILGYGLSNLRTGGAPQSGRSMVGYLRSCGLIFRESLPVFESSFSCCLIQIRISSVSGSPVCSAIFSSALFRSSSKRIVIACDFLPLTESFEHEPKETNKVLLTPNHT